MRLFCSIPTPEDATSFYRAIGPLSSIKGLDLIVNQNLDWVALKRSDAVFLQRPFAGSHIDLIWRAKEAGKKVWVDYDDNLLRVPSCNPKHFIYSKPDIQANIVSILQMADVVTVSTQSLKDDFSKLPEVDEGKITVIRNAYDTEVFSRLGEDPGPRSNTVVWRGSFSHAQDLLSHQEEIAQAMLAHPEIQFEFIGEPLWLTVDYLKSKASNIVVTPPMDTLTYFRALKNKRPKAVIVPLEDNLFNRGKSNIAFLEAIHAGAQCVAPHWDEWQVPGCIGYNDQLSLSDAIDSALQIVSMRELGRDYIAGRLTLAHMNQLRMLVLDKICQK